MKIAADQIEEKAVAGETKDGSPVVYILSKGGLHVFFAKNKDGQIEAIGASPHKAISSFFAEKKCPGIKWDEKFLDKNFMKSESLDKSEGELFLKFREMIFTDKIRKAEMKNTGVFLVYDISKTTIEVLTKADLIDVIKEKDPYSLVRDTSLSQKAEILKDHEEFAEFFKDK